MSVIGWVCVVRGNGAGGLVALRLAGSLAPPVLHEAGVTKNGSFVFAEVLKNSTNSFSELVHMREIFRNGGVNNVFPGCTNVLFLLGIICCSRFVHIAILVNKLCISNRLRKWVLSYDVHSSLKELRWTEAVNRLMPEVSRIIPGNWGKAESGWLARPLLSRIARFGSGGRIHQFL